MICDSIEGDVGHAPPLSLPSLQQHDKSIPLIPSPSTKQIIKDIVCENVWDTEIHTYCK